MLMYQGFLSFDYWVIQALSPCRNKVRSKQKSTKHQTRYLLVYLITLSSTWLKYHYLYEAYLEDSIYDCNLQPWYSLPCSISLLHSTVQLWFYIYTCVNIHVYIKICVSIQPYMNVCVSMCIYVGGYLKTFIDNEIKI